MTKRLALIAALALLVSRPVRADQTWTQNQHATNAGTGTTYSLDGLGAATLGTSPLRLQDVALGSCLLKVAGALPFACGVPGTDYQLGQTSPDGSVVFPTSSTTQVRPIAGLSVYGRAGASAGTGVDITAGAGGLFLGTDAGGTVLTFRAIPGTTGTPNTLAYFNGAGALGSLTLAPEFTLGGPFSLTANGVTNAKLATMPALSGKFNPTNATATPTDLACSTAGTFFGTISGTSLVCAAVPWASLSGTTNAVTDANLAQMPALTAKVNATNALANAQNLAATGGNQALLTNPAGTALFWGPVPSSATTGIVAGWPIANARWFAVDGAAGSDSNVCWSDTSAADAGTKACATIAGLLTKFPSVCAGHKPIVIINRNNYSDDVGSLLSGTAGCAPGFPQIRATGTLASAGATAFADDAADAVALGAVTATGMNAAGYNPTGAATTVVIPLTKVGGADPGFPSETTLPLPLGARIRFDSSTATASLRNVARTVIEIDGTNTVRVPVTNPLPIAPTASDVAYLEMPGVNVTASPSSINGFAGSAQVAGVNFSGATLSINSGSGTVSMAFDSVQVLSVTGAGVSLASTYAHPSLGAINPGGVRVRSSLFATRAPATVSESTVGGTLQTNACNTLSAQGNSAVHDVWLVDSGYGVGPNYNTFRFGGAGSDYVRILSNSGGSAFAIYNTKVEVDQVQWANAQSAYPIELAGEVHLTMNPLSVPYAGAGIVGFGKSHSFGFKMDQAANSTIVLLNYGIGPGSLYQVTGGEGDFQLPNSGGTSGIVPGAYADMARLGAFVDVSNNRVEFGATNSDLAQPVVTGVPVLVKNDTGSDIPAGSLVQISGAGTVDLAKGDAFNHVSGPLGITTTIVKNGSTSYRGYAVTRLDGYRAPFLDGTIAWPADLYASPTLGGYLTAATPAPGKPARRVAQAFDTGFIRLEPEQGTIWNQQILNGSTPLTQRTWLRCDGTTIVCADDGTNFWTNVSVGTIDLSTSQATGILKTTSFPALTGGPVTTTAGSVVTALNLSASGISGTLPIANQAAPTGTGFDHITAGVRDGAARAVSLATSDVTGLLPVNKLDPTGGSNGQVAEIVSGVSTWTSLPTALPPSGAAGGALTGSYPNPSIANSVIVGANFSNFAANTLFGNPTGSAAAPTTITLGTGLSFSAGALNVTVAGGADALGSYWVSGAAHAPANAVNWGALGNGVHEQTTSGGVATPSVFTAGVDQMAFGAPSGGGLQTDADWTLNPATHAITGTGSISLQGPVTTIGNWSGMGTYAAGVVGAFSAGLHNIPYGSGSGGLFTQSNNLQYDGAAVHISSADGTANSLILDLAGSQTIEKRGSGILWFGTQNAGQDARFYTGGSTRLTLDGTSGLGTFTGNVAINGIASNSLVKTDSGHTLVAAAHPADYLSPSDLPASSLILYSQGPSAAPGGDGTFSWDAANHVEFLMSSRASDGAAIVLGKSNIQAIQKEGAGDLFVGTSTAYGFDVYTNNATRLTIDSSGNARWQHYGGGVLLTDASGNMTANALPASSLILYSTGVASAPGGDGSFSWDAANHVLDLTSARASDGASIVLGRNNIQAIQKEGTGDV